MIDLSIIIVNWNSADYLRKCLESIKRHDCGLQLEVIVVDNASFDGSHDVVQNEFPGAIFVQSQENMGFARANNLGFQHSAGENLLFLNPDTEVLDAALKTMVSQLRTLPNAGAVGGKLLSVDLSLQTDCVHPFPTILNQMLDADILRTIFPKANLWGGNALFSNDNAPVEVDAVSGACVMVKRQVFEQVGHFSTDYFMYSEDIDLCYKLRQKGYKTYYVSDAKVIHFGGGSSSRHQINNFDDVLMRESAYRFMRKFKGRASAELYRALLIPVSTLRLALTLISMLISGVTGGKSREHLRKVYTKWKKVLWWALGFEDWSRA